MYIEPLKPAISYVYSKKTELISYSYYELKSISKILSNYYKENVVDNDKQLVFFGFDFSDITGNNKKSRNLRLRNPIYIFKKLSKRKKIYSETILFNNQKGEYCTNNCLKEYNFKLRKRDNYLKTHYINFGNYSCNLLEMKEISEKSKISEIYNINKCLEEKSIREGRVWMMITLTAPGIFHINPIKGKSRWEVSNSPLECDKFLTGAYRAAYKTMDKYVSRGTLTKSFGAWSKEPHKSGAVHMHILLYVLPDEIDMFKKLFTNALRNAFRSVDQRFYKDKSIDFKVEDKTLENSAKGSTYIFKYIMKSLNVMEYKPEGKKRIEIENGSKISAHNALYSYKRFSFIGIKNCLSKWRVVRQIAKSHEDINKLPENTKAIFDNAVNNNFLIFSELSELVKLKYKDATNKYDEETTSIVGVEIESIYYAKPIYTIEYIAPDLAGS